MKRFWLASGLLAAMTVASLVNAACLGYFTGSLTQRLQDAEEMAERGAWQQAETITRQCLADWEDNRTYLHIIARHADTDQILISFRCVLQSMGLEEMDEYAAANLQLITQLDLLAEIEQPTLLNVL